MPDESTAHVAHPLALGVMRIQRSAASVISKSDPVPIRHNETDHADHGSAQADRVRTDRGETHDD